jgi:hypothetical protein
MKIRIAIPENPLYKNLTENVKELSKELDFELYRLPEQKLEEFFLSNRVDAALINPLIYARGITKGDFRIIRGPAMFAEGYTGIVSMYFKPGLTTIDNFTVPAKNDYLMIMAKLLLAERYGIIGDLIESKDDSNNFLDNYDAGFVYGEAKNKRSMDLTEDWTDQYNISLPLAFWAVRNEEEPPGIIETVHRFAKKLVNYEEIITAEVNDDEEDFNRNGKIIYKWFDYLEKDLDDTLELLYMHQYSSEMATAKLMASSALKTDTGAKVYTDGTEDYNDSDDVHEHHHEHHHNHDHDCDCGDDCDCKK